MERKFRWKNFIETSDNAINNGNEETKPQVISKITTKDNSSYESHRIHKFYLNTMTDDESIDLLLSNCDRLL